MLRRFLVAAAIGIAGLIGYGSFEARRVVLERVTLPGSGPRLLIGQISDVDFRRVGHRERVAAELLRETVRPDLLVVTGDLLEFRGGGGGERLEEAIDFVEQIPAPLGTFWVVGESEAHHVSELRTALAGRSMRLLFNEEVRFTLEGHDISIFGLGKSEARFEAARWAGRPAVRARSAGLFSPLVDASEGAQTWRDYETTGSLQFGDELDYVGVLAYAQGDPPERAYALIRHRDRPSFHLRGIGPGAPALLAPGSEETDLPAGAHVRYRMQVESRADRNLIRARVWRASEPEPEGWHLAAEDPSHGRPTRGAAGVCVKGGGDRRYFGPWSVRTLHRGAILGGRDLVGFELADGTWRFRSVLRDWAAGAGGHTSYRMLLAHNPDAVLDLESHGVGPVDLVLAGHTQGGQVRLPILGALYTGTELGSGYAAGLVAYRGRQLYVNRGLGTSLIPLRILCPPEVTALSAPFAVQEES